MLILMLIQMLILMLVLMLMYTDTEVDTNVDQNDAVTCLFVGARSPAEECAQSVISSKQPPSPEQAKIFSPI